MGLRECPCDEPVLLTGQNVHPLKCHRCSSYVRPEWLTPAISEFFDRLENAFPTDAASIAPLRLQAEVREAAGRKDFGLRYLSRDNALEGTEEAADLANYAFFEVLKARRNGEDEEEALAYALEAAYHAAKAHQALLRMRAHYWTSISPS